jgi:hypothetical protein
VINALTQMFGMIQFSTPYANLMDRKGELVERFNVSLQNVREFYVDAGCGNGTSDILFHISRFLAINTVNFSFLLDLIQAPVSQVLCAFPGNLKLWRSCFENVC